MKLLYEDMVEINEYGYVAAMNFNGLFKINRESNEAEFITMFPDEDIYQKRLFIAAKRYQNKIIFVPLSASKIAIFDIVTHSIVSIPIPEPKFFIENYNYNNKFTEAVIYEESVFLVCATYPGILKLNMINLSIEICNNGMIKETFLFRKGICLVNNSFFACSVVSNMVLEFNLKDELITTWHVGNHNNGAWGISYDVNNNCFWLTPKVKGPIICWNKDTNIVNEYFDFPIDFMGGEFWFTKGYVCNENFFLLPGEANMAIKFNIEHKKMYPNKNIDCQDNTRKWYLYENIDYFYYIDLSIEVSIYKDENIKLKRLNKTNGTVSNIDFPIICNLDFYLANVFDNACHEKQLVINEGDKWNLETYINTIYKFEINNTIDLNAYDCGEKIHSYVKRCLN